MREWMLEYLRCPATKARLRLEEAVATKRRSDVIIGAAPTITVKESPCRV